MSCTAQQKPSGTVSGKTPFAAPSRATIPPGTARNAASTGVTKKYNSPGGITMHKAGKRASLENIQPSSSLPTRRTQVGHLLIAALAGLRAGLAASLSTLSLLG